MEGILKPAWGWRGWLAQPANWVRGFAIRREPEEVPLRVEGRLNLAPKKQLVLVNCRGRQVLLALSGDTISPVMEIAAEPVRQRRSSNRARGGGR